MPTIPVFNTSGVKQDSLSVSPKIFGAKLNPDLMAQAVRVYLSNQRQSSAKTKRRGEVKVSHKKIWRQKGTGRARHGSRNAPIFVGGGRAHGPTGTQNYSLKMPKKMKRLSLFSALSGKLKAKAVIAVSGWEKLQPKTKLVDRLITKLKLPPKQLLLVLDKPWENIRRSTANLPYLTVIPAAGLTTYTTLKARVVIFTKPALSFLESYYFPRKPPKLPKEPKL